MVVDEEFLSSKLLCIACLCVGRNLHRITDEKLLQYYTDILDELPLNNSKQFTSYMVCWECRVALQKCCAFKEQVKESYRVLHTYTKKNFHKCLKASTSKPPRLKIRTLKAVDIPPTIEVSFEPLPVSKTDVDDDWQGSKDGSSIEQGMDDLSDTFDNEPVENGEEFEKELQSIMSSIEREDKKRTRDVKRSKKMKSLKEQNKGPAECAPSDIPIHLDDQTAEISIEITPKNEDTGPKSEVKTESEEWGRIKGSPTAILKEEATNIDNNIDKKDLETELQSIMTSIESEIKKKPRGVESKVKKSNRIVKTMNLQKQKRPKYEPKVLTVELTYEEMMSERERDSQRESYLKSQLKCESCLIGFQVNKCYQAHVNSKHSPDIGEYICPICKTFFASVDSFTYHYKRHMRRYECGICQKRTADLKVMQQHYYSVHEISLKEYTCNICGQISNSIDAHRYHKDSHKARVECKQCDKTFRHRAGLMNHRLAVHECHNAFPCTYCDKVFRWKTSLKRHLEIHEAKDNSSSKPYCSMCCISFASICSYQRHMKNSLKHVSQDQLKYICDHCKRRFSDKTKLRDHIEEKHLNKTYQCHICAKPSKNRVGLDQHIRNVHKGRPKNKMCHHCGRGFPTTMQLESHIRTHTGERPFICEYCPTTFSQKSNWYKHYRQVHLNIKSKRYPLCKKRSEETADQTSKVPTIENNGMEADPFRPIVLQYSPERGFVL